MLLDPRKYWECPNCEFKDVTYIAGAHSRFHSCAGLKGLSAPMIPSGTKAKVYAKEREDYIGKEIIQVNEDGRPIMSIVTERDDGQDCAVLAPCIGVTGEA